MITLSPYDILGVKETDDDNRVREAYRRLVCQYPPEDAPELFQDIRAAYEGIATQEERDKHRLFSMSARGLLDIFALLTKVGTPTLPSSESLYQLLEKS